ncbi:hypothetical protein QNI19_24130 [Cytophagaceae bacterium DM2B3-1]|uniref:DUF3575 domain-containing protein n=1 Tax=Xanthocytophaga flava TaxID=3048013 RepID=A0ABT7CQS5_9BACT|nr:hypothetical protein [Xanthocytophaga flavus]MDJ1496046.1 hypothetical protein [Xanthocytophaga flavus]
MAILSLFPLAGIAQDMHSSVKIGIDISKMVTSAMYLRPAVIIEPSLTVPLSHKWFFSAVPGYTYIAWTNRTDEKYRSSGFSLKAGFESRISNRFVWSVKAVGSLYNDKATFFMKGEYYGDTTLTTLPELQSFIPGVEIGILWRVPMGDKWNMSFQARTVFYNNARKDTRYIPGMGFNGGGVISGGLNVILERRVGARKETE